MEDGDKKARTNRRFGLGEQREKQQASEMDQVRASARLLVAMSLMGSKGYPYLQTTGSGNGHQRDEGGGRCERRGEEFGSDGEDSASFRCQEARTEKERSAHECVGLEMDAWGRVRVDRPL
jgi:hypothetical protein